MYVTYDVRLTFVPIAPFSSLLTIGQTVLLNFNIEADRHARNIESEAKTAGGNNSASFTHANQVPSNQLLTPLVELKNHEIRFYDSFIIIRLILFRVTIASVRLVSHCG